eukprot:125114-Rhodomonas_salina.1
MLGPEVDVLEEGVLVDAVGGDGEVLRALEVDVDLGREGVEELDARRLRSGPHARQSQPREKHTLSTETSCRQLSALERTASARTPSQSGEPRVHRDKATPTLKLARPTKVSMVYSTPTVPRRIPAFWRSSTSSR